MKTVSQSFEAAGVQSAAPTVNSFSALFEWRRVVIGLWVFAGYYLGAKIGFALTFQPHPVSVLWPPNSILVAALLLTPPRIWWFVLLAAFPAHCAAQLQSHVPPLMILCWFISNSCEALIGAGLARYLVGGPIRFTTLRNVGIFCLCVVVIGPFLSSFLDAAFVVWNKWGEDSYWELIRIRLFSNALAALIVVPLVVTWATTGIQSLWTARLSRYLEGCALFVGLLLVSYAVLYEFGSGVDSALLFLPLPFLLWAAVRFGALGASTATSIVGFLAIWSAAHGHGPFSGGTAEQNALSIQTFLIVLAIPLLFLATVIEERATREAELRESEARINLAANAANLGVWLWKIPGDELWVTEQWRRLFGFADLEPVTFDRLLQVVHPEDRERVKQRVQHLLEHGGGEHEGEYRIIRPDGSIRWIAGHGSVELDEHGKPAFARGLSRDITDRKMAEEELRESEERFRTVANAAPVFIWMSGVDKLCTFFNKPWLKFTGRTMEQEMGNGWAEGVHPDDLQKCLQTYTEAFNAREPFVMEYRLRRHDGEYRWISDNGVPRYDTEKNFTGYIGSCVDITESLSKEQALRESEERMTMALEAAHVRFWDWNYAKDELWGTKASLAQLGLPLSGKVKVEDAISRVHVDDRDRVRRVLTDAARAGKDYHCEYRIIFADGTEHWTDLRGRHVMGADGEAVLRSVSIDVTERKRAEEKFRLAVEASPSGILLVDQKGQIVLVNSHIEELFRYGREELIGKSVEILVPERFATHHPEYRTQFFAAPTARAMGAGRELFGRRKDGSEFPVEIGLSPIQTPEGMLVLSAVVDISARKLAEAEAIQRREEVGHLSRLAVMGELTASIAHELNQPLSGIISNASAGERFIDRGNVDLRELRELLADIVADGRRAGEVIRGIRNMVKKGSQVRPQLNLNDLVTNVVHMVKSDAMLRSCDLNTFLEPDLPSIEGDPIQLQQVLLNLLVNAFDAMRDTPLSRRKVVIVTERNGNDAIRTSVRDYGTGIPAEAQDRLFDHFFTTKAQGLGMGLAIVRSIVESHSGTIAGENAEGGGARFHFTLPVSRERAAHSAI
jgi:PAS domain S-box-containing protein